MVTRVVVIEGFDSRTTPLDRGRHRVGELGREGPDPGRGGRASGACSPSGRGRIGPLAPPPRPCMLVTTTSDGSFLLAAKCSLLVISASSSLSVFYRRAGDQLIVVGFAVFRDCSNGDI
jgi:hypothetical protein